MAYRRIGRKRRRFRRKRVQNMKVKHLAKMIKSVSLKNSETKIASDYAENLQCTHNGTYYRGNLFFTRQGTGDNEGYSSTNLARVGDEIIARGLKLKWWLSNKGDRPNVMYNIYVFYYNTLESPTNSTFWRGTDGVGGVMNRMLDQPNPERIKVLKKFSINSKSQFVGTAPNLYEHSQYRECWIPFRNKKIVYRRDNSGVPQKWDIGFCVVTYDAYGTLTTDTIASFAWSSTLYFKDP